MTCMEKNNLYDEVCRILTDYEEGTASGKDLYIILCNITNKWEEITG